MGTRRAVVSWSGGKDSALAFERASEDEGLDVVGLFTTIDASTGRVFHHDIPVALIQAQADAIGVELISVPIPPDTSQATYGELMRSALEELKSMGVTAMVFGDIHLAAVRERRETKLEGTGIQPVFPLWGSTPETLIEEMLARGVEARVVSIDTRVIERRALGARLDRAFIDALPSGADRCGELGEYHTFVAWSPSYEERIPTQIELAFERPPFAAVGLTAELDEGRSFEHEDGIGWVEAWAIRPELALLEPLLTRLFVEHWHQVVFGPLIQGAAWEVAPRAAPHALSVFDGYMTVHFEELHFHLCIGETKGDDYAPTPPSLAARRRVARAELFRRINRDGTPDTWGLRLFNGAGEQQITVLFPNPFVTRAGEFEDEPDWAQLKLWDALRSELLGLRPDPRDRAGERMLYP